MAAWLTKEKGRALLELARQSLAHKMVGGEGPNCPEDEALQERVAAFVTLKIEGRLRGCIGTLEPVGPLWETVRDNAINAAFHDSRFSPLQPRELQQVHLDVSVLTEPELLLYEDAEDLLAKLRPNRDGVILSDGRNRATFLPQVWQQLPDPSTFLNQLCVKAGLPPSTWREKMLDIRIYQVQSFAEERP